MEKYGDDDLKKSAENNDEIADNINKKMSEDPELRQQITENRAQHSKFDEDMKAFFKAIGKGLDGIFKKKR